MLPPVFDTIARERRALERLLRGRRDVDRILDAITRLEWLHVQVGRELEQEVDARERLRRKH